MSDLIVCQALLNSGSLSAGGPEVSGSYRGRLSPSVSPGDETGGGASGGGTAGREEAGRYGCKAAVSSMGDPAPVLPLITGGLVSSTCVSQS